MTACTVCRAGHRSGLLTCDDCREGRSMFFSELSELGLDDERKEQFRRMICFGFEPKAIMLRVIADLTDDTRLPGKDQEPVGTVLRRFRKWQATVRRISELLAAPRGL